MKDFECQALNPKTRQNFDNKSLDYLIKSPKCDDPLKKKRRSGLKPQVIRKAQCNKALE